MAKVKEEVATEMVLLANQEKYRLEIESLKRRNQLLEKIKPLEQV